METATITPMSPIRFMPDALWSLQDVADYLGVCKRTLYALRFSPNFPQPIKLHQNAHPRYRAGDVIAWSQSNREAISSGVGL